MIILVIFLWLLFFEHVRRLRLKSLCEDYGYQLYALRDELRDLAIESRVQTSHWLYAYLDDTIGRAADALPHMSVARSIVLYLQYKDDEKLKRSYESLTNTLEKPENADFFRIHDKYVQTVRFFLISRHLHARRLIIFVDHLIRLSRWLNSVFQTCVESPETLRDLSPAGDSSGTAPAY